MRLVSMDDLMQEPDSRSLMLCHPHLDKWRAARMEPSVATPVGTVIFCAGCGRHSTVGDAAALADFLEHQYGTGPKVGWLCPRCRETAA